MSRINRRKFLQATAAAGAGYWLTASATSAARAADRPNGKLQFAGIGVGGKGSSDVDGCAPLGVVVALCDIDDRTLQGKKNQKQRSGEQPYIEAQTFHDYREMLEKMGDKIDAVTVSTADHMHAPASIKAIRMGKHVYCQKPLTHTVWEARQMRLLAREHKVCTQMGNQGTAENGLRRAVEIVQAGVLGQVTTVHVWTNRPVWGQAPHYTSRPMPTEPPKHVHWDLFLGAAPERPYSSTYPDGPYKGREVYHPFSWRGWWDFGTGALGDMACHTANMAYMALKLGSPTSAEAEAGDVNPETCPSYAHCVLQFPARGSMAPVTWHWYEGKKDGKKLTPPEDLLAKLLKPGQKLADSGSILVGDKGILFSPNDYGAAYTLVGDGVEEAAKEVPQTLPRNGRGDGGMKEEWVKAIRENKPEIAMSNFDYAGMLTEAVLLGNVAIRTGKKIEFDGEKCEVTNAREANSLIRKQYRKGFEI